MDNEELRRQLSIDGERVSIAQLYDGTTYRLQALMDAAAPSDTRLQRAISEVDERVRLVAELIAGTLIQPAPEDTPPLPAWRLQLELWNNRFPLFDILFALFLFAATVGFVFYIRRPAKKK